MSLIWITIITLITLFTIILLISLLVLIFKEGPCYKKIKNSLKGTQFEPYTNCIYKQIKKSLTSQQFNEFCNFIINCNINNVPDCGNQYLHQDTWKGFNNQTLYNNLMSCNIKFDPEILLQNIIKKIISKCATIDRDTFITQIDSLLILFCPSILKDKTTLKDLNNYLKKTECNDLDVKDIEDLIKPLCSPPNQRTR